ncbi:hypothetical protein HanIR_Chr13g0661171 [Helianthus annuus]|nr:hypothetical protein HanIR_Chr13g0661171 [Helianthus annuus]
MCLQCGCPSNSQKNHVSAVEVESLPASMKLMIMSLKNFLLSSSSNPISQLEAMNLDNKSSLVLSPICVSFDLITSIANSFTVSIASLYFLSLPMLKNLAKMKEKEKERSFIYRRKITNIPSCARHMQYLTENFNQVMVTGRKAYFPNKGV